MVEENRTVASQSTGNPVLDSFVNLLVALKQIPSPEKSESIHAMLLKLAKQEPGGLYRIQSFPTDEE